MARILLTTLGSYGDLHPFMGLALALAERGHQPTIATSPSYRDYVEREGIRFHPVRPDVELDSAEVTRRLMSRSRGTRFLFRDFVLPALRDSYRDLSEAAVQTDLLVTHPLTFAGPILAEEHGLPWISTVLSPISFFSRHELPIFPNAPWLKRLERLGHRASALVIMAVRAGVRNWSSPVRRLRRELGLPRGREPILEGQHSPEGVLALFSRVLAEPQPDWPTRVHLTGNILYDGPRGTGLSSELEAFLDGGEPPVVFTLGSAAVRAAGSFYQESVEAVRRLGCRAVLLLGDDPANRPPDPLPEGVIVSRYAPHGMLFPRAAAVVHQGGMGTLAQALRAGRPMVVVPFAHDQPDNAHRAERLGVAWTIDARRYTGAGAAVALRHLLGEAAYSLRAEAVARIVRQERAAETACRVIEARLEAGR